MSGDRSRSLGETEKPANDHAGTARIAAALFIMAFGYALLSVCLFKVVSLVFTGTAFFVFYVSVGMPAGGWLAWRRKDRGTAFFRRTIFALIPAAALMPAMAWLSSLSPDFSGEAYLNAGVPLTRIWALLAYQTAITFPFFALWGAAEFNGFGVAMGNGRLRRLFYILFVWALVAAMAFGQWSMPRWGWLRTVAVVPAAALVALDILRAGKYPVWKRLTFYAASSAAFLLIGPAEKSFQIAAMPTGYLHPSDAIRGMHPLMGSPLERQSPVVIERQEWGRFCHFTAISTADNLWGYYDGVLHWWVGSELRRGDRVSVDGQALAMLPKGADVCLIGCGGGKQVQMALAAGARRVVAVEVVPEAIRFLKNEGSRFNNGAYLDPRVETVVGDGRKYLEGVSDKFDLIMLPYTESCVAAFKGMFEPGESLHTVEAMRIIVRRLKPGGVAAVIKGIDINKRLYDLFARTMREAGMGVEGWHRGVYESEPWKWEAFLLIGCVGEPAFQIGPEGAAALSGERFIRETGVGAGPGPVLRDNSPWIMAVFGNILNKRSLGLHIGLIVLLGLTGGAAVIITSTLRGSSGGSGNAAWKMPLILVSAGMAVGANFVCVENAVILWLVRNMFNPLQAFFVGSALFLLVWGAGSFVLRSWKIAVLCGAGGAFALVIIATRWQGNGAAFCLAALALGGGVFFPLLAIRFERRLLDLFISDAIGAVIGGMASIWLPLAYGIESLFMTVPVVWLVALLLVVLAISRRRIEPVLDSGAGGRE